MGRDVPRVAFHYLKVLAVIVVGIVLLAVFAPYLMKARRPRFEGSVRTFQELEQIEALDDVVSYLPAKAHDIHYYKDAGYFEVSLRIPEKQFLNWASTVGWGNDIEQARHPITLPFVSIAPPSHEVRIARGFYLTTTSASGDEVRVVAYNPSTSAMFAQMWYRRLSETDLVNSP